jgi:GntR family transcriptional regulator
MIENEEFSVNDPIPTERELCAIHGISRMTAREAIMSLVNEGVLYREQGKGTFVSSPKPKTKHQLSDLKGLTEDMELLGHKVETKVLFFQVIEAPKNLAKLLNLLDDQRYVVKLKRLRIVDQVPYAIETVWLNQSKCQGLTRECVEGHSLYKILRERYSLFPHYARQTVEPVRLNEYESKQLGLEPDSLALLFNRTTYSTSDDIIEYTKGLYRIDKHKFEIILKA